MVKDCTPYTYFSDSTVSWLDHIVCTQESMLHVENVEILYAYISSDHHPIAMNTNFVAKMSSSNESEKAKQSIKWDTINDEKKLNYTKNTKYELENVPINHDVFLCVNPSCKDSNHCAGIKQLYENITSSLTRASKFLEKNTKFNSKQVCGWNLYCKEAHREARANYLHWKLNSKPRQGIIYEQMKKSRAYFKFILRTCKNDIDKANASRLANTLLNRDDKSFWKNLDKLKNSKGCSTEVIDNVVGNDNIASMWKDHFSQILNSSKDYSYKQTVMNKVNNVNNDDVVRLSPLEINWL